MSQDGPGDLVNCALIGGGYLLWPSGQDRPAVEWCDPSALAASAQSRVGGTGRGATLCFDVDGRTLVLRRYRRGGMVRRLGDRYLRLGLRRSRAWRELALLVRLQNEGLPVPQPVAAWVEPVAPWAPFARQVLLTEYLPATRTLTEVLRKGALEDAAWDRIGVTIARMHRVGVDHADLNAHNILVDAEGGIHLIDFDRGRFRKGPGPWCAANLKRLRRSLDKLSGQEPGLAFRERDWEALERGYGRSRNEGTASDSTSM